MPKERSERRYGGRSGPWKMTEDLYTDPVRVRDHLRSLRAEGLDAEEAPKRRRLEALTWAYLMETFGPGYDPLDWPEEERLIQEPARPYNEPSS